VSASSNGFACERCKGTGKTSMTFTFRGEPSTPTSVPCSNCGGLGCVELAKWARRNDYRVDRQHDTVKVIGRVEARGGWRYPVLVGVNPPIIQGSLGVVLFWALAFKIVDVLSLGSDAGYEGFVPFKPFIDVDLTTASRVVECIAACSRPLCRLPDLWEMQIDARLVEVVIDEVVDSRARRRMGKLTEVARARMEAATARYQQEQRAAWDVHPEIGAACRGVTTAHERLQTERAVIRDSIAGVDPYEPEWCAAWWLALREWTSAGKEPDADAMTDILRGLLDEKRSQVEVAGGTATAELGFECSPKGEADFRRRAETALGYHAEMVEDRIVRGWQYVVDGETVHVTSDDLTSRESCRIGSAWLGAQTIDRSWSDDELETRVRASLIGRYGTRVDIEQTWMTRRPRPFASGLELVGLQLATPPRRRHE
jgi:hypothetical protein